MAAKLAVRIVTVKDNRRVALPELVSVNSWVYAYGGGHRMNAQDRITDMQNGDTLL
jgi:uncharacterized ParB-like nuclease family protein